MPHTPSSLVTGSDTPSSATHIWRIQSFQRSSVAVETNTGTLPFIFR